MSTPPSEQRSGGFLGVLRETLSQGDVLTGAVLTCWDLDDSLRASPDRDVLVLNHDCDLDKPSTKFVLLCPVYPVSRLPPEMQEHVRNYRVFNALCLGALNLSGRATDVYADFRLTSRATVGAVKAAQRVASLDDETRLALQRAFARWLGIGR